MKTRIFTLLLSCLLIGAATAADTAYQPFILASHGDAGLAEQTAMAAAALEAAGFTVAGQYSPVDNANVIVVTSPELQGIAARSAKGGYAAGQRVSVTEREGRTEVAFVNPLYIQYAYRLEGDMQPIYDRLATVLGEI